MRFSLLRPQFSHHFMLYECDGFLHSSLTDGVIEKACKLTSFDQKSLHLITQLCFLLNSLQKLSIELIILAVYLGFVGAAWIMVWIVDNICETPAGR